MRRIRLPRRATIGVAVAAVAALFFALRCSGGKEEPTSAAATEAVLEPADVAVAVIGSISAGPLISGSLQAGTEAVLRAEIAGTAMMVAGEEGQRVRPGTLLARIADPTLTGQSRSAESAVRSAEIAVLNARRDVERYETLVSAGASPRRDLETARTALASTTAQLANAQSLRAEARESLANATIESPIDGIISSRSISAGDVVQIGAEMFRIIDPSTMQLEASVASDQLYMIRPGAAVDFEVRGYPRRTFIGKISSINPSADPATRQVTIHVAIPNPGNTLVAGLFAEGRVTAEAREGLLIPSAAITTEDGKSRVSRVRGGRIEQVGVVLGIEDEETKRTEIVSGLDAGDTVLIGPAREMAAGTAVRVGTSTPVHRDSR